MNFLFTPIEVGLLTRAHDNGVVHATTAEEVAAGISLRQRGLLKLRGYYQHVVLGQPGKSYVHVYVPTSDGAEVSRVVGAS
jgi:hypothetical protein